MKKKAIFLMGPTAMGKTDLAIALVQEWPLEIISVDSAMVYRGLDIGTGKPMPAILHQYPHHLIDICDPKDIFSAALFVELALEKMHEITNKGKIPLLVGGTMLYFHALINGLSKLPSANQVIRQQLEKEAFEKGWNHLHQELMIVDPKAAAKIHPNDPQRIQRALEVYRLTGQSISKFYQDKNNTKQEAHFKTQKHIPSLSDYEIHSFCIAPEDRAQLHSRIERRFDNMLQNGLIDEVNALFLRDDLYPDLPAIRTVGYRQIYSYLSGDLNYDEMRYKVIVATRQLAKRQLTWLRNSMPNVKWLMIHYNHNAITPQKKDNLDDNYNNFDNNHLDYLKTMIHCVI